jgi:hypothetical protein
MGSMHDYNLTPEQRKIAEAKKAFQAKMKAGAGIMAGVLCVAGLVTACRSTVIDQGNFGIEKHWGGTYNAQPIDSGLKLNLFDKIYEVYGREMLLKIENVRPKDKSGTLLEDLDLNVGIKVNKENSIPFLLKKGDIVYSAEKDAYILGVDNLIKETRSASNEIIRKFESEELLDKQSTVEETFKKDLQEVLNNKYGNDTFTVTDVKLATIVFAKSVEEKIQSIQNIRTEEAKAIATEKVLKIRNEILNKEVKGLKDIATDNNISFDQLLDYQKTRVLMEGKVNAQLTMPAASTVKPK